MKHKPPEVKLGSHSRARCPSATPSGPPLPLGFVLKAPGWGRLLAPQRFPLPRVQGLASGKLGCRVGSQDADYPPNRADSISQHAARRSGRATPARPQSGRELRFPEGGARASAARIGPMRVCGGWTSGVRGLSLCSGARGHTGVGDPSATGPGGVPGGVETRGEGCDEGTSGEALGARRGRGRPSRPPNLGFSGYSLGRPAGLWGGGPRHMFSDPGAAGEAASWAPGRLCPGRTGETEARNRDVRVVRRFLRVPKCRL